MPFFSGNFRLGLNVQGSCIGQPAVAIPAGVRDTQALANAPAPGARESLAVTDIQPREEDFVRAQYRALSNTVVASKTWRATYFPEKVLKKAAPLLAGRPLYKDHNLWSVSNIIGKVVGTAYGAGHTLANGVIVPPGINADIELDSMIAPELARNLLRGNLDSVSVTVDFMWEASHEFENEWDFYNNIGGVGSDGKQVVRVVTEILGFAELSLVWSGADPFAKEIGADGKIRYIQPSEVSSDKYKFSFSSAAELDAFEKHKMAFATERFGYIANSKPETGTGPDKPTENMNAFQKWVQERLTALGIQDQSALTEADLAQFVFTKGQPAATEELADVRKNLSLAEGRVKESSDALASAQTQLADTKDALTKEQARVKDLETKLSEVQTQSLATKRAQVLEFHRKANNGETDPAIKTIIDGAEESSLAALAKSFGGTLAEKFSGYCKSCKSEDIAFGSSAESREDTSLKQKEGAALNAPANTSDIRKAFTQLKPIIQ